MKITLQTKPNRAAVAFVTGCVPKSTHLEILSQARLYQETGPSGGPMVRLSATDLDVTLTASLDTDGPGLPEQKPCCLPAKRLAQLFKTVERITIDSNCNVAAVTMDGNTFKLNQMDVTEYPAPPTMRADCIFELPADVLTRVLRNVEGAICADETRYVLNGIYFNVEPDQLTVVATNGRSLHRIELGLYGNVTGAEEHKPTKAKPLGFILPKQTLSHLHKLLKAQPSVGHVLVEIRKYDATLIRITGGLLTLTSKLIDGTYPNYRQVIPTEFKESFQLPVAEFLAALRKVEPFTTDARRAMTITLTPNVATLTVGTPATGVGTASVDINYRGEPFKGACDPGYIIGALLPHKDARYPVHFKFTDENSPYVIASELTTAVIMPMRMS